MVLLKKINAQANFPTNLSLRKTNFKLKLKYICGPVNVVATLRLYQRYFKVISLSIITSFNT